MRVDSRFTVAATAMPARLRPQLPPGDGVWLVAADGDAPPAGQIIGTLATGDTVWLLGWDGHLYTEWGVLSDGTPSKVAAGSGVVLGPNGAPLSFGSGQKGES